MGGVTVFILNNTRLGQYAKAWSPISKTVSPQNTVVKFVEDEKE
jgi:hypothetical protein